MQLDIRSQLVHGAGPASTTGSISTPIYQTATFQHPGLQQTTGYDYSRTLNPTRERLEQSYAQLEGGCDATAYASGMAAISAIFELFVSGDHILVCEDLYGGSFRFFQSISAKRGISFSFVDFTDLNAVQASFLAETRAVFFETPTNPMMKVIDIAAICQLATDNQAIAIVDNTFLTPYLQRPHQLGAELVVSSATKFLAGHNDTLCGLVSAKSQPFAEKLRFIQNTIGAVAAPFDSWLVLRGLKTLAVRLQTQQENSLAIAQWLAQHHQIERVIYPGLPTNPYYSLMKQQADGFGAMISFEVKDKSLVAKLLNSLSMIAYAESLGGVESLITYPILQTHADMPVQLLKKLAISDTLLRLSVGIESVGDLIHDLETALSIK